MYLHGCWDTRHCTSMPSSVISLAVITCSTAYFEVSQPAQLVAAPSHTTRPSDLYQLTLAIPRLTPKVFIRLVLDCNFLPRTLPYFSPCRSIATHSDCAAHIAARPPKRGTLPAIGMAATVRVGRGRQGFTSDPCVCCNGYVFLGCRTRALVIFGALSGRLGVIGESPAPDSWI